MLESTISIRPARASEAGALHDLAALTFPLACPPSTTEAAKAAFIEQHLSRAAFEQYLADPHRLVLVAERGDEFVGYAMLVHGEPADPEVAAAVQHRPTAELSKLYVHPDQHGGGVASALVEHALHAAVDEGAVSVWLGVNIHNARANRFYEKAGFPVVGTKGFVVGDVIEDDFVRERQQVFTGVTRARPRSRFFRPCGPRR
ncbi:MAG: GNAT family N-acetyltransferase [Microcella sp.]|nr:GNAT family N-acetyltransferase [Microcella sp.]